MTLLFLILLTSGPASDKVSEIGESCTKSADCSGALRCIENQCVMPGTKPQAKMSEMTPLMLQLNGKEMPYRENMPIPPGMHVETRTRIGVWATGLSFLASSWFCAGLLGTLGLGSPLAWLPVIGGFISPATTTDYMVGVALATQLPLGFIQVLGFGLFVGGLVAKKKVLVFGDEEKSVSITPLIGPGAQGLSLSGRF